MEATTKLLDCGHAPTVTDGPGTGYGQDSDGRTACYSCCAQRERDSMIADGRALLYLSRDSANRWQVTNWTGYLSFPYSRVKASPRAGGFGADRFDVWFRGPDGATWHGINRGDNQVLRCRRLKVQP